MPTIGEAIGALEAELFTGRAGATPEDERAYRVLARATSTAAPAPRR